MRNAIVFALLLAACSKSEPTSSERASARPTNFTPKLVGGCDHRAGDGYCREYWGTGTAAEVKEICASEGKPFIDKCPTESAVGRCVNEPGTPLETHALWYGDRGVSKEQFPMLCKAPMEMRAP